jgi:hypothetical protein
MIMHLRSLSFFEYLAKERGRPDLAAANAAGDGRLRLAVLYNRQRGLSPREAWKDAWWEYRCAMRERERYGV